MAGYTTVKHGLSPQIINDLCKVFAEFEEIEQVLIFGSRARGIFRDGSDIDLAVIAPRMNPERFTALWNKVDALPIVFKLDCLHYDHLTNENLKKSILTDGVSLCGHQIR